MNEYPSYCLFSKRCLFVFLLNTEVANTWSRKTNSSAISLHISLTLVFS